MTTSALPQSQFPFSKDTLEGDYKGYRREIWSRAAYDTKEHGKGQVKIYFALIKPDKEAIVASIYTGWYLSSTIEKWEKEGISSFKPDPMGGPVDFHWAEPQWEGDEKDTDCLLIDGGECYGNTGFTIGESIFAALVTGGFDAVWEILYKYLRQQEDEKDEEE